MLAVERDVAVDPLPLEDVAEALARAAVDGPGALPRVLGRVLGADGLPECPVGRVYEDLGLRLDGAVPVLAVRLEAVLAAGQALPVRITLSTGGWLLLGGEVVRCGRCTPDAGRHRLVGGEVSVDGPDVCYTWPLGHCVEATAAVRAAAVREYLAATGTVAGGEIPEASGELPAAHHGDLLVPTVPGGGWPARPATATGPAGAWVAAHDQA